MARVQIDTNFLGGKMQNVLHIISVVFVVGQLCLTVGAVKEISSDSLMHPYLAWLWKSLLGLLMLYTVYFWRNWFPVYGADSTEKWAFRLGFCLALIATITCVAVELVRDRRSEKRWNQLS